MTATFTPEAPITEGGLKAKRGVHLRYDIYVPDLIPGTDEFVMVPLMEDDGEGFQAVSFHDGAEAMAYIEGQGIEDAVVVETTKRLYRRKDGGRMVNAKFDYVPLPPLVATEAPVTVAAPAVPPLGNDAASLVVAALTGLASGGRLV